MEYNLRTFNGRYKKEEVADIERLKEIAMDFCDSSFIGEADESTFENEWNELIKWKEANGKGNLDILRAIIIKNFEDDTEYYDDYEVNVFDTKEEVIIVTCYLEVEY